MCCTSFLGTPTKYMWPFLGNGVGAEDPWCSDAEPGHRERLCKQLFESSQCFSIVIPCLPLNLTAVRYPACNVYLHVILD